MNAEHAAFFARVDCEEIRVVRRKLHGLNEATLIGGAVRTQRFGSSYQTGTSRTDHPGFSKV